MTMLELKRTVLQKVFAITDGQVVNDDTTQEYLTALPAAANEGLQRLATVGRFLKRCMVIIQDPAVEPGQEPEADPEEDPQSERVVIRRGVGSGGQNAYDLAELLKDFYSLDEDGVYFSATDSGSFTAGNWRMQGGQVLFLPAQQAGAWTIWYNAYPPELTMDTEEDYVLPIYPELAVLLPLYIASQIYKDDDLGVATQYRNEFEVGLESLRSAGRGIQGNGAWISASGWWNYGE